MTTERDFQVWMRRVEAHAGAYFGVDIADLPDCDYRSMFENEYEPREAARIVLEGAEA